MATFYAARSEIITPLPWPTFALPFSPYAYLRDLFTKLANGHLARNIDALMPWAYVQQAKDA